MMTIAGIQLLTVHDVSIVDQSKPWSQIYLQTTYMLHKFAILLLNKSCTVHMTVFEIVVYRNDDNWIQLLT